MDDKSSLLCLPPELQYLIISHLAAPVKPLIPNWSKLTGIERAWPSSEQNATGNSVSSGDRAGPSVNVNLNGYGFGQTISIVRTGIDVLHGGAVGGPGGLGDIQSQSSHGGGAASAKYYDDAKRNLLIRHHRVLPLMLVNRYFYATVTRYLRNPAVVFSGEQLKAAETRWREEESREDMKHLVVVTYHEDWRGLLDPSVFDEHRVELKNGSSCSSAGEVRESEKEDDKGPSILGTSITKLSLLTDMTFASVFFKRAADSVRNLTYLNLHINSGPLHKVAAKDSLANIPGQFSKTLTHCYLHGNRIAISHKMFQHGWPNLKELYVDSPVIGLIQRDISTTFKATLTRFADMVVERDNARIAAAAEANDLAGSSLSSVSSSRTSSKGKKVDKSGGLHNNTSSNDKTSSERTRVFVRIRKHHSTHAGPFFLLTSYNSNRGITSGVVCWYPRPAELNTVDEDGTEYYYQAKAEEWSQIELDVSEYHYAMEHGFFDDDSDA